MEKSYEEYLKEQGLKPDTVSRHQGYIRYFLCWAADNSLLIKEITHSHIQDFADGLQREGRSIRQVNSVLLALRYYFRFLGKESLAEAARRKPEGHTGQHKPMGQKHKFSAALLLELRSFEHYLQEQQQSPSHNTIRQHKNYAGLFLEWLAAESLSLKQVSHAEMLDYADKLKEEGHSINYINRQFLALRYYFEHLQKAGLASHNPAAGIRLKGGLRSIPQGLLSKEELNHLYESYAVKDERSHRNKVILSLLIFQGLANEDLHKLEARHIKLKEGKIHVPAGKQTNSRILKLEAEQIMELFEYIHVTRSKILAGRTSAERSGRKPKAYKEADTIRQLFISMNGCENFKTSLYHLNEALRKINPKLKNAVQIRQSVITEWLKEKDLRTVQYMAGHRYVSSTERYQTNNLEDLKEALSKHHPRN